MAEDNTPKQRLMLVETTGDFMFTDSSVMPGQDIQPDRPTVVRPSTFVTQKIADKQLDVLDAEWSGDSDEKFAEKWEKDPKATYGKSKKVDAAMASRDGKSEQVKMNDMTRTGATPRTGKKTPDTLLDTPEGRDTFDSRVKGKADDK